MESITNSNLLTVREFAKLANVSESTLRKWIMLEKIDVVRIGRCVRIPDTEINKFYTANKDK